MEKKLAKFYLYFSLFLIINIVVRYIIGENLDSVEIKEDPIQYIYVCSDKEDIDYYDKELDLVLTKFGNKSCTTIEMP